MARIGDTFRLHNNDIDNHLHIIISDPSLNTNLVTANFTSWRIDKDQSCIIEVGEHSFIRNRSCVDYRRENLISLVDYERFLKSGDLVSHEPVSTELLKRILCGAEISPFITFGNRQILVDQGLIDVE